MIGPASRPRHLLIAGCCAAFVLSMLGAAYAAVPLYDLFCKLTGYAGTTRVAVEAPDHTLDRTFEVSFDANIDRELPWTFVPEQRRVTVRAGEVKTILYRITNRSQADTVGVAGYNVTPMETGAYFAKINCFCFTDQKLGPGESLELPVTFFVDPAIAERKGLDAIRQITLSYSYYPSKGPAPTAGLAPEAPSTVSPRL